MGNTGSVEVPRKGSKTTQKLSKPRTGDPLTAGLLDSNGLSDKLRIATSARRRRFSTSLVSPTSPSIHHIDSGIPLVDGLVFSERDSLLPDHLASPFLQPDPSTAVPTQRSQSIELAARPSRDRRMSRTNPSYIGPDENEQVELGAPG